MRRLLAGLLLAGVAACGGDDKPAPTVPSVDVSANTEQVCAAVEERLTQSVAAFTSEVPGKIAQASGSASAQAEVVQRVKAAFAEWAALMRTEGARAADPGLRSALAETATQFDSAAASIRGYDDLKDIQALMGNPALAEAGAKLQRYCGGD